MTSGSTALYVFLYSVAYFAHLEGNMFITYVLYFSYMTIISLGFFLLTGERYLRSYSLLTCCRDRRVLLLPVLQLPDLRLNQSRLREGGSVAQAVAASQNLIGDSLEPYTLASCPLMYESSHLQNEQQDKLR